MNLFFLRHGPALSRELFRGHDDDRPLTTAGEERTRQASRGVRRLSLGLAHIVSSPLARAERTARIVAEEIRLAHQVTVSPLLSPGFDAAALEQLLSDFGHIERLMLIGHEPDFSSVVGEIVGSTRLVLKKAGLCRVELRSSASLQGTLRWLLPPQILVELGR